MGLEVESPDFPEDPEHSGPTEGGPLCVPTDCPADEIIQLAARSPGRGYRTGLEGPEGFSQPTMEPCGQSISQGGGTESQPGDGRACVASPAMVPSNPESTDGHTRKIRPQVGLNRGSHSHS